MKNDNTFDWSKTTFEGIEKEQMIAFRRLTLREKLKVVERMADTVRHFIARRKARGLPFFDPHTGRLVWESREKEDK